MNYLFHHKLILRTPAYPFNTEYDKNIVSYCLKDDYFKEALFLASPDLYYESMKLIEGNFPEKKIGKITNSVLKYYSRASSRCTPFGLFAGCSVLNWGKETSITLLEEQSTRHSRLDMKYLCSIANELEKKNYIKKNLTYFSNNTAYLLGNDIRYVEYQYENFKRIYQITSVYDSNYLFKVIDMCTEGLRIGAINQFLVEEGINEEQGLEFINNLIDAQLLLSELEPVITGQEFFYQLLQVLERIYRETINDELEEIINLLKEIDYLLKLTDKKGELKWYEQVLSLLKKLNVPFNSNEVIQTDLIKGMKNASVDIALQDDLAEAIEVLTHLCPPTENRRLEDFKNRFRQRYEDKEMPLLKILDSESGIGYNTSDSNGHSYLIEDLELSTKIKEDPGISNSLLDLFLNNKLKQAEKSEAYEININKDELASFPKVSNLPPSFSVMFKLTGSQIIIESVGGSSAINLLSRFAHAHPDISKIALDISQYEELINPDIIFAEILHLPESRVGNVLLRPVLRKHEIPYLTKSNLPLDNQISLQDIMISVRQNQILLRSKHLNKIIIPRLSTAHNYHVGSMPIYRFLCDLQFQGLQSGLTFNWSAALEAGTKFFPRLCFKNTILHEAMWKLNSEDFDCLLLCKDANDLYTQFTTFKEKWRLPRLFTLSQGDNELLIDSENYLTIQTLVETIKNTQKIKLKEYIFNSSDKIVTDTHDQKYANQFIASVIQKEASYSYSSTVDYNSIPHQNPIREFELGSEWLYYKFYCGTKISDQILVETIAPLIEELKNNQLIEKWFFIRYEDPDFHLRIRFLLNNTSEIGQVIKMVGRYSSILMKKGYIWKSQTDTYRREIERYGFNSIELIETFFYQDSESILSLLGQSHEIEQEADRWLWSVKTSDELLTNLGFNLERKAAFTLTVKEKLENEFGMDKSLKIQLDQKYRQNKYKIANILNSDSTNINEVNICYCNESLKDTINKIIDLSKQNLLQVSVENLSGNLIHMHLNRLISYKPRLHEMIIYNFLFHFYQSQIAINKKSSLATHNFLI